MKEDESLRDMTEKLVEEIKTREVIMRSGGEGNQGEETDLQKVASICNAKYETTARSSYGEKLRLEEKRRKDRKRNAKANGAHGSKLTEDTPSAKT